jgi:signal transduction histidine kinase
MKILIVDGDPSGHAAIAEVLTKQGCHLLEVNDGEEALEVANREKPAIAIVDMLTPNLDRSAFVRRLRHDPVIARMPVIFYTSGYMEIASGVARDVDHSLTPILLCEEAIRGKMIAEHGAPGFSSNGKNGDTAPHEGAIVQEVFSFAYALGGEHTLIRPGDFMAEIVSEARRTFPKSIVISTAYSEDLWLIEGDRLQLHRVLVNLFTKAREAMPDGGALRVWARNFSVDQRYASMTVGAKLGRYVMLRVSDTGRGMPRPVSDNIFAPFREGEDIGPGTNLGLIKSHGGFISVYSEPGKGTTFQIFLPAKVLENERSHARDEQSEGNGRLSAASGNERSPWPLHVLKKDAGAAEEGRQNVGARKAPR